MADSVGTEMVAIDVERRGLKKLEASEDSVGMDRDVAKGSSCGTVVQQCESFCSFWL